MSNKKKLKNLEEWDKRYRLNNPVYNLNYNNPSFYAGIVASFIGSIPAGFFGYGTTFVTRFALLCFAIGYAIDWYCKKEWCKARERYQKFQDL